MSRFIVIAICLALIVALFPLPDFAAAAPLSTKLEPFNVANQSAVSPYDGTYSGTFNYEYRGKKNNPDYYNQNSPTYHQQYLYTTDWIQASFTLTVTLKTRENYTEQVAQFMGVWPLDITNIIVSDPIFGTGLGGVTPITRNSGAALPFTGTTTGFLTDGKSGIWVYFPNGSHLEAPPGQEGNLLKVGFAEWTLSGDSWSAYTFQKGSPLSVEMMAGSTSVYFPNTEVNFKSWSLKKVPSSGLTTTTPATTTSSEATTIKEITGTVYVRKNGTGEWTKYDGAALKPGDEIKTGDGSKAVIEAPDSFEISLSHNSALTIEEWSLDDISITLLLGRIKAWVKKTRHKFEVRTPTAVTSVRGTEFTVDVDADGTTTIMVFDGTVSVQDRTSNKGIMLAPGQMVTISVTPTGLTQEEMLGRVTRVPTESLDRWWEKSLASTGEQPAVHPEGSLVVGKFEIMKKGSGFTPAGFIFAFTAIAAIFFLAVGQVFAYRLRRLSKRK